jgi:tetratricopeptide (TPR) repeat protein
LRAVPDDAKARCMLAFALAQLERYPRAIEEARAAIAAWPNYAYAHYALSYALQLARHAAAAQDAIRTALALDPRHAGYHVHLAELLLADRAFSGALASAEEGLACDPERVDGMLVRARALRALGRLDEAAVAVAGALSASPASAEALAARGELLSARGDRDAALAAFREAIRLDPRNGAARAGLVDALKASRPWYRALRGTLGYAALVAIVPALVAGARGFSDAALIVLLGAAVVTYVPIVFGAVDGIVTTELIERNFGPGALPSGELGAARGAAVLLVLGFVAFLWWALASTPAALVACASAGMLAALLPQVAQFGAGRPRERAAAYVTFVYPMAVVFVWGAVDGLERSALIGALFAIALGTVSLVVLRRLRRGTRRGVIAG